MSISLYYKGLDAEDRIFAKSPNEAAALAKGTLYEAWFDVLQTSPWYREIAKTGIYPSKLAQDTWEYFGDLTNVKFDDWWMATGFRIFAEAVPYFPIQVSDLDIEVKHAKRDDLPPILKIEVPLNLSRAALQQQFDEILRAHAAFLDDDRWNRSTAPVHQYRESKLTYQTIKKWLQVYKDYERLKQEENITLYDFALSYKLLPRFKKQLDDTQRLTPYDRQVLSNATSDILKPIRNIMANATEMQFPNSSQHEWATVKRANNSNEE